MPESPFNPFLHFSGFFAHEGFTLVGGADDHYGPGVHRRDFRLTLDEATIASLEQRFTALCAET